MHLKTGADERDWIGLLRSGAETLESICAQLFLAYYPRVRRVFEQRGVSPEDAEDLAQETLFRVCQNLQSFRGEASFSTWVFMIARNVERGQWRRSSTLKRSHDEVPLEEEPAAEPVAARPLSTASSPPQPQVQLLTKERYERASHALQKLPDQMRLCFILRFDQELHYREIAEVMQISIQTVKSHLYQARQRLKSILAEDG